MGTRSKSNMEKRKRPHLIVTSKPREEIRRAQIMVANFAYDPDQPTEVNEENISDMLDALGIRACVKEGCCR